VREPVGQREDAAEHGEAARALDGRRAEAAATVGPCRPARGRGPRQQRRRDGGREERAGEYGGVGAQGVRAQERREGEGPPGRVGARGGGSSGHRHVRWFSVAS
jgi:hypothetical protein